MREVDGMKVAFLEHGPYFESLLSPSMVSTARDTGADAVFLLAPGMTEADVSDDDIRNFAAIAGQQGRGSDASSSD